MKKAIFISLLKVILFMSLVQANAQEANSIIIENRVGRITWLFADSAESSVLFFNLLKDMYDNDSELYEYNINNPTDVEQMFLDLAIILHDNFFECYADPKEENSIVMGQIDDDQVTEFQVYVLSTGFRLDPYDINFIIIHNTVNGNTSLFCNIENF